MLKLHIPWEERGWNFYAFGVTEDPNRRHRQLRQVAGAGARRDRRLGDAELGLGALFKRDQKPRFGVDLSDGVWDFDLYGDVGIRYGARTSTVVQRGRPTPIRVPGPARHDAGGSPDVGCHGTYAQSAERASRPRRSAASTGRASTTTTTLFTIGAEYFYNQPGYADPSLYPGPAVQHSPARRC